MYYRSSGDTSVNDARLNLLARKGRMMQYHLISLPSGYIQSELPTKEELSGAKPLSLDLSQKVQLTGDIVGKATRARYIGLTFHQLLQVVKNYLVWLQEGLLWEVQMFSLWGELYSFV